MKLDTCGAASNYNLLAYSFVSLDAKFHTAFMFRVSRLCRGKGTSCWSHVHVFVLLNFRPVLNQLSDRHKHKTNIFPPEFTSLLYHTRTFQSLVLPNNGLAFDTETLLEKSISEPCEI